MSTLQRPPTLIPQPFEDWREDLCRFMAEHGELRRYERKAVFFNQGDEPEGVYAIKDGLVDIGSVNDEGREVTYAFRGPSECFGFAEIILGEPRYRSAMALTLTDVWVLDTATFVKLMQNRADISLAMLGCTLHRLNRNNEMRIELRGSSAERRIAYSLAQVAHQLTSASGGQKVRISINLTHEELSRLCDISRQTVTFTLDRFRKEGIIDLSTRAILIYDTQRLWEIATEAPPG